MDAAGQVLGVVFGAAIDDDDTGFALTTKQIKDQLAKAGLADPVDTGKCISLAEPHKVPEQPAPGASPTP